MTIGISDEFAALLQQRPERPNADDVECAAAILESLAALIRQRGYVRGEFAQEAEMFSYSTDGRYMESAPTGRRMHVVKLVIDHDDGAE